jgi:hypothetical protein
MTKKCFDRAVIQGFSELFMYISFIFVFLQHAWRQIYFTA